MLSSPWIETASHENRLHAQLRVPVPSDVFKYVLDFAYMDSASSIHGANTVESLCEVLASADLLLMNRLKQTTEVRITPLLTLKNVAMVEEVASAFNSAQLYKSCLQFACHHLPALLHTPAFHFADQEFFEGMETYYRSQIPYVFRRSSPPSMEGPNVSHIPKEDSNDEEEFTHDQHPLDQLARSPKKRRPSEAHFSRKMRSRKSHGIMLSDLLNRGFVDEEDEILMRIAPTQDQTFEKIKTPESDFSRLSIATTSNTESLKKRSGSSAIDTLKENTTLTHAASTPMK
uniref:BTB domain-containing protein n=1 Tax=Ciona savignyi TaxID=51511 RepID=H2ZMD4_CIOSA